MRCDNCSHDEDDHDIHGPCDRCGCEEFTDILWPGEADIDPDDGHEAWLEQRYSE